jgi:hypothetical protein
LAPADGESPGTAEKGERMGEASSKRYARDPDIVCRRVATEIILVPIRRNVREVGLYTLNEVAAFVWEKLDGKHRVGDLVQAVVEKFDVSEETARRDIDLLLAKLEKIGGIHEA